MKNEEKILIYKWLWTMEVYYQNRYIDKLNNFMQHDEHGFQDYLILFEAEKLLNDFRLFGRDLTKILQIRDL